VLVEVADEYLNNGRVVFREVDCALVSLLDLCRQQNSFLIAFKDRLL